MTRRELIILWLGYISALTLFMVPPCSDYREFVGLHPLWEPYGEINHFLLIGGEILILVATWLAILTVRVMRTSRREN